MQTTQGLTSAPFRATVHPANAEPVPRRNREAVVLLHGLAANTWLMTLLQYRLRSRGYHVHNWGYSSIWRPLQDHSERFSSQLRELDADNRVSRIHLVGHSMGAILVRRILCETKLGKMGRIVMLAPPNRGSRVARILARGLGWACPPLSQLSDEEHSYVNLLPVPSGLQVGVIAAQRDRVVALESTHLPNQRAHVVLPCGHNRMLFRSDVATHIDCFLQTAEFANAERP